MADQMKATPRSPILGLFSDIVNLPLQYMSAPQRTQQMQGAAEFLYGTGIPKTLERMSYGDSLFSGSGMTLRPKEETINAAMNVAPFAPAVGRLASRAVRATEGMPVGMGIKDVSPKIGINVNQGGSSFADKIISGEKKFETRESDSLRSYVGKRVGIIRTGEGKAKAIGDVTLGEPIVVSSPEEFAKLRDLHLVPEGSKFDIKEGGVKYLYPIENPVPYGVEKDVAKYGIVSRKILGEPDTLEKAIYPQQAALDLAQQRAALPVEQGGLGLPANNTPEMRAQAMRFDTPAYRGYQFGTGRNKNTFYTDNPEIASQYAVKSGGAQYEINAGGDRYLFDTLEEAKRAQQSGVGGKIKKLKNSPIVEANLLRMENPLVVNAKEQNWNFIENPFAPAENLQTLEKQLASVTSDKVVNGRLYTIDQQKQDIVRANYFNVYTDTNRLAEEARKKGYSDTVIQNVYDTALPIEGDKSNYLSNVYVSSNPENVRSRFAAFDPFRKDVATATAMGVALPDLLAQPVNQYQPTYETIPMYTDPFGNTIGSSIR